MRISDWSSAVCSSDLRAGERRIEHHPQRRAPQPGPDQPAVLHIAAPCGCEPVADLARGLVQSCPGFGDQPLILATRSEEHTSELQSLMRISYAVFCLQKKNKQLLHLIIKLMTTEEDTYNP